MLAEGLAMVAGGSLVGLAGVLALGRLIESQLHGVRPGDPSIMAGVLGVVAVVALVACLFPARRAAGIDPVRALNDL